MNRVDTICRTNAWGYPQILPLFFYHSKVSFTALSRCVCEHINSSLLTKKCKPRVSSYNRKCCFTKRNDLVLLLRRLKLRVNGRNNSYQCWELLANNICCFRLNVAKRLTGFKRCAATPNNTQQLATECANGCNM